MAEKKTEESKEKAGGGRVKWIILILLVILLLGGAGAAAYFFLFHETGDEGQASGEAGQEPAASAPAAPPAPAAPAAPYPTTPLLYHELDPLTVNITTPGPIRFLRLKMVIATHNEAVAAAVDKHMPRIRNDLLSLLATQDFGAMNTPGGKDALRAELKTLISGILTQVGEPSEVSAVLFTDFVMQ